MCTVTYIPTETGFLLTSNRDEKISRPSLPPMKYRIYDQTVFFPKEKISQGTWIATSENLFTLCLLNGAFHGHISQPPYRKSRGLVLLDFFAYNNPISYAREYDFHEIEPFTLIIISCKGDRTLHVLRWDGHEVHLENQNVNKPHIWSSSTLYTEEVRIERQDWFQQFLKESPYTTLDDALFFHHFGGNGNAGDSIVMQREKIQTISITSIEAATSSKRIIHEDLLEKKLLRCRVY
jgi:hypothetical protein